MTHFQGGLYPTVALSDAFNTIAHVAAAHMAYAAFPQLPAFLGFAIVSVATGVGTLRFGFSESLFAKANGDLAHLSAFLGLPLVGVTFAHAGELWKLTPSTFMVVCVCGSVFSDIARSFSEKTKELVKKIINLAAFIGPIACICYDRGDTTLALAAILFVVAGVVVGSDHHSTILGVRRVNIFHYMLGTASYGIAMGLSRL
mmetsp:Transcript_35687/g.72740  ORF Transcript_35687/g.72740 Transcript_35687/m.72740 type:complete len:201 (-) Transcript_35687:308-910(-)